MFNRAVYISLISLAILFSSTTVHAENNLALDVLDEQITLHAYPADGNQLVLFIAPSYGFQDRSKELAATLADMGIEVWLLDLIDNLFLPRNVDSIRTFTGNYVANVIEQAHSRTGKNITLLSSSYGAIPLLRGAHQWQVNNPGLEKVYLNGAILFSPELYRGVPVLGEDPEFEPIVSATNIPVMIYQSELRNNRWQLDNVINRLSTSNAVVYHKILPNIVSYFHQSKDDADKQTLEMINKIPSEFPRVIKLLQSTTTPLKAADLLISEDTKSVGLDSDLRKYEGIEDILYH